ncbi:hypothetical protein PINS_up014691 [Pythium insidiosum]|nr:hypothetical protein PINS_up014691 [Pythium insidiosum]
MPHQAKQQLKMKTTLISLDVLASKERLLDGVNNSHANDKRCVLYSTDLSSAHRFVEVRHHHRDTDNTPSICFASLRKTINGSSCVASPGLIQTLALDRTAEKVDIEVRDVPSAADASCSCRVGSVQRMTLQFLDRKCPPKAVLAGLKATINTLLASTHVWEHRSIAINWFNSDERVVCRDIVWAAQGSCCAESVGVVSVSTTISLAFATQREKTTSGTYVDALKSVEEYVEIIQRQVGGSTVASRTLISTLLNRLSPHVDNARPASVAALGAVITGLPGSGKTLLAKVVGDVIGVPCRHLNAADVFQTYVGQSEATLAKIFEEVARKTPSLLIIDGLEALATTRHGFTDSDSSLEVGVLGTFIACLDRLRLSGARTFIIGTTSRFDDLDSAVYSNGRMEAIVRLEPPSQQERKAILQVLTNGWPLAETEDGLLERLSDATGGYVGADLLSVCQKALQASINDPDTSATTPQTAPMVGYRHFEKVMATTFPSVLQAHHMTLRQQQHSDAAAGTAFAKMYGADDAINAIRVSLIEPLEDCSRYLRFGTVPPRGILLTGPPGSGKTHMATVVAAELKGRGLASFVSVRCADLLTKVVGDTEKALRELFQTARSAAPCVIFFDQIESIAPVRGFDTSTEQTFDRLLSMLLVEMDGFATSRQSLEESTTSTDAHNAFLRQHVVILASTTHKHHLDPAILRPGRFDVHIHLSLPDRSARVQLVLDCLLKIPIDFSTATDPNLHSAEGLAAFVADNTEGFTAADLSSLFREAAMATMRSNFEATSVSVASIHEALEHRQQLLTSVTKTG